MSSITWRLQEPSRHSIGLLKRRFTFAAKFYFEPESAPEVARATQIIDLCQQHSDEKAARNHKARESRKALRNGSPFGIFKHGSSQSLVKLMLAQNGNCSPIPEVWWTQCHFGVNSEVSFTRKMSERHGRPPGPPKSSCPGHRTPKSIRRLICRAWHYIDGR